MAPADLLLHPVRLRIVQAFLGERVLTTAELRAEVPDVPVASLYRHVHTLADAGVLAVEGERKVRGAVERSYRLVTGAASVDGEAAAGMAPDDHARAFATFAGALLGDFGRYLRSATADGRPPDLAADRVGYRQVALWLTDEEFDAMVAELQAVLRGRLANGPGGGRRRRVVTTVHLPAG